MWKKEKKKKEIFKSHRFKRDNSIKLSRRRWSNDTYHNYNKVLAFIFYQQWSIVSKRIIYNFQKWNGIPSYSQLNKRLIKIKIFRTIYSVFVCTKFNSVISNSVVQIYYTQFTFARNVNIFGIFEKLFKQNCAFLFFLTQRKKISKVSLFMNNKMQLLQLTTFRK